MKESPSERIQEISASKFRINVLGSNNIQNNIANDIKPSLMNNVILNDKPQLRRRQNNNEFNLGNNELNTSNTNENNIPSASTILLQKIVDKADILVIEIINSLSLNKNTKIHINALGMMEGSKRQANDGCTFFGLRDEENSDIKEKDVDFIMNSNDIIVDENSNLIGRHFRIRFDINTMQYYIKDLGCGFGTFKKILKKAKLKDSYLLNIGNSYIVCTFGVDEYYPDGIVTGIIDGDKTLNIKVFSEIPQAEPHFFNPKQFKKIYIGRDISCNIIVDDSLLSRVHCTIEYDDEEGWVIYDGKIDDDERNNKPSTNGTWLYLIEEIPIEDGLIFKNNKNAFECHLIKQDKKQNQI